MARLSPHIESLVQGLKDPRLVDASRSGLRALSPTEANLLVQATKSIIGNKQFFVLPILLLFLSAMNLTKFHSDLSDLRGWTFLIVIAGLTVYLWFGQRDVKIYWLACTELRDIGSLNSRLESIELFLPAQRLETAQSVLFWEGVTKTLEANAAADYLLSERAYISLLTCSSKILRQESCSAWQQKLIMAIPETLQSSAGMRT